MHPERGVTWLAACRTGGGCSQTWYKPLQVRHNLGRHLEKPGPPRSWEKSRGGFRYAPTPQGGATCQVWGTGVVGGHGLKASRFFREFSFVRRKELRQRVERLRM